MSISAAARHNHDQLFGDRVSTLARTDPELVEYFDNFAFDDVIAHSDLDLFTSAGTSVLISALYSRHDRNSEPGQPLSASCHSGDSPGCNQSRGNPATRLISASYCRSLSTLRVAISGLAPKPTA